MLQEQHFTRMTRHDRQRQIVRFFQINEAVSALEQNFPSLSPDYIFSTVDQCISSACGVGTDEDKWQRATEQQLMLRDKIQENIVLLADVCQSVPECVNKSIEKAKIKVLGKCATVTGDE